MHARLDQNQIRFYVGSVKLHCGVVMVDERSRLRRWQALTLGLMFLVYSGYYLCRSNLSVSTSLIIKELASAGRTEGSAKEALGWVVSLGTLGYALGKFLSGALADRLGGRRNVLVGMAGSIACTLLFATGGGLPVFTTAWVANRLLQSLGWVGMVKITSRWFSHASYGRVMAVLSLSFLVGDAASRWFMGLLFDAGLTWRGVFFVAAGVLSGLLLVSLVWLKESPVRLGLPEPPANPANVYGDAGVADSGPSRLSTVLGPLVRSRGFWLVCLLSFGLTLLRETFTAWTPSYFARSVGMTEGAAAGWSGIFPLLGGVSVLLVGFLSDRYGRVGRAAIIAIGLSFAGAALALLGMTRPGGPVAWPVGLVAAVGFLLIGPYSFLAGAISLDLGGKKGSATASGLIDGVGYLGGTLAGVGMARVSNLFGWHGAFRLLAGVAWASAFVALLFLLEQRRLGRVEAESEAAARTAPTPLEA
jgi:OPA family glycerol-3-phosphate transporter-like MFS transporter